MSPTDSAADFDPNDPWVVRARSYGDLAFYLGLIDQAVELLFWGAAAWLAWPIVGLLVDALHNRWLVLAGFVVVLGAARAMIGAPLAWLSGYRLEHRFELSTETPARWLWRQVKSVLVGAGIGLPMLAGFFALLWYGGAGWPIALFLAALLVSVGLARVFPVWILPLFYPSEPIADRELVDRLARLAEGTGLRITGVYRLALSRSTRKANAALVGVGRSRRVLLGDTLIDAMSADEVATVFAHELGHHVCGHLRAGLLIGAAGTAVAVAITWAVMEPVRGEWAGAIARLPLLALITGIVGLLAEPLSNGLSRRWERQADRFALERMGSAEPFISGMMALARQNLSNPHPPRWRELLFYSHPSIGRRLAAARRWARRRTDSTKSD